jgi:imidazolonepropionase-like amidohydrolase
MSAMTLLVTNVTLIDGTGADPVENAAIAIEGSRITYAGRASDAPRNVATTIDGRRRRAVPGLINAHTHITLNELDLVTPRVYYPEGENLGILQAASRARRALENGITSLRDCNAPGYGTIALRTAFSKKLLSGPRLFVSGCAICATGGHMYGASFEADGADEVRKGVRKQVKFGANFIKLVAEGSTTAGTFGEPNLQLSTSEMAAGVEVAHRLSKKVTAHVVTREGAREALAAGVDCLEHGYDLPEDVIATMLGRSTWVVPTLSVHDSILRNGRDAGWTRERLKISERVLETAMASAGRAFRAGVNVACGTDAGSPFNPVWDLVPELRLLCQAGLTPGQALEAATRRNAELIGVASELGTLEPGKFADILLVEGDPLRDVGALCAPSLVIKDGDVVCERPSQS